MLKTFASVVAIPFAFAGAGACAQKTTVVHAGHMLDGVSKAMQGPVTVVLQGGRITSVKARTSTVDGALSQYEHRRGPSTAFGAKGGAKLRSG